MISKEENIDIDQKDGDLTSDDLPFPEKVLPRRLFVLNDDFFLDKFGTVGNTIGYDWSSCRRRCAKCM